MPSTASWGWRPTDAHADSSSVPPRRTSRARATAWADVVPPVPIQTRRSTPAAAARPSTSDRSVSPSPFPPPPRYSSCTWQCESNHPAHDLRRGRAGSLSPHHLRRRSPPKRRHPAGGRPTDRPPDRCGARSRPRLRHGRRDQDGHDAQHLERAAQYDSTSGPGSIFQGSVASNSALAAPMSRHVASERLRGPNRSQAAPAAANTSATGRPRRRPDRRPDRRRRTWSPPRWPPGRPGCPGCWPGRRCSARRSPRRRNRRRCRARCRGGGGTAAGPPRSSAGERRDSVIFNDRTPARPRRLDQGLAQFLPADEQLAVDEDLRRRVDAGRQAHGRPPHAVEAQMSLPIRWCTPATMPRIDRGRCRSRGGEVVDERVVPDVEDVPVVPGDRHAPVDRGPGDRDVLEATPDEAEGLVALGSGTTASGWLSYQSSEPVCSNARQLEEVVLLRASLDRRAVHRAELAVEQLDPACSSPRTRRSTGPCTAVDVAVVVDRLQELLHAC